MCVFVFENSKDCLQFDQVTRSNLPTQKSFLYNFYSFDIVVTIAIGKQSYLWMLNGTGVGHRMTMITIVSSIFGNFP